MENDDKVPDRYLLIGSLIALVVILVLMVVRDSWLPAIPVYVLGSLLTLYAVWRLTEPADK